MWKNPGNHRFSSNLVHGFRSVFTKPHGNNTFANNLVPFLRLQSFLQIICNFFNKQSFISCKQSSLFLTNNTVNNSRLYSAAPIVHSLRCLQGSQQMVNFNRQTNFTPIKRDFTNKFKLNTTSKLVGT